jgi:N-acetylmuramoyl-L-alanine amidase
MIGRNVMIILTGKGRNTFLLVGVLILLSLLLGTVLYAHNTSNPLAGKSILIDPGHGGIDGGTGDGSDFLEKDANLEMALILRDLLRSWNVNVSLTRDSDVSLDDRNSLSSSRHKRDLLARVAEINSGKYDMFISIHVNKASTSSAIGPMVLFSEKLPKSRLLSQCLKDRLNTHAKNSFSKRAQHKAHASNYFILSNATIPGALVETGFISNTMEKRLLWNEEYRNKLMRTVVQGMKDYFYQLERLNEKDLDSIPSNEEENTQPFHIETDVRVVMEEDWDGDED